MTTEQGPEAREVPTDPSPADHEIAPQDTSATDAAAEAPQAPEVLEAADAPEAAEALDSAPVAPPVPAVAPAEPVAAPAAAGALAAQAPPVQAPQSGPRGKTRGPVAVWLLAIVTLGIYGLVWYYKINKELAAFHPSIRVNPTLAMLSLFVPIVALVSIYNTGSRVAQAQRVAGGAAAPVSAGLGLLLAFVFSLYTTYYQAGLNAVWNDR